MSTTTQSSPAPPTPPRPGVNSVRVMNAGMPGETSRDFRSASSRLLTLLRQDRIGVGTVVVLAVVGVALTVVGPKILGHATDVVIHGLTSP
ncbi:MAG TPA: hypothetical protein VGJ43_16790, partial [Acidimicrobiales bacterium]